jgi:hypothetical protein
MKHMSVASSSKITNAQAFIDAEVQRFTDHFCSVWKESSQEFPSFASSYSRLDHKRSNTALASTIGGIDGEMKVQALAGANRGASRERLLGMAGDFARGALGFEDRHVDLIRVNGFFDVVGDFARQASA